MGGEPPPESSRLLSPMTPAPLARAATANPVCGRANDQLLVRARRPTVHRCRAASFLGATPLSITSIVRSRPNTRAPLPCILSRAPPQHMRQLRKPVRGGTAAVCGRGCTERRCVRSSLQQHPTHATSHMHPPHARLPPSPFQLEVLLVSGERGRQLGSGLPAWLCSFVGFSGIGSDAGMLRLLSAFLGPSPSYRPVCMQIRAQIRAGSLLFNKGGSRELLLQLGAHSSVAGRAPL